LLQDADGGNALYGTVEAADGGGDELYDIPDIPELGVEAAAAVESAYAYLSPEAFENAEEEDAPPAEVEEKKKKKGINKKRRGSVVVKKDGTKKEESAFDWGFEMDEEDGDGAAAPAKKPAAKKKTFVEKPHAERRRSQNIEIVKMQRQSMKRAKAKGKRSSADEAMEEFGFGFDEDGSEFGFGDDSDGSVDIDAAMSAPAVKPKAKAKKKPKAAAAGGGGGGGDGGASPVKKKKKKKGTGTAASTTSAAGGKKKTKAKKKAVLPVVPQNMQANFLASRSARSAPSLGPGGMDF